MLTVIFDPTTSATMASAVAVGDPSSTRTVYITTVALLVLSLGLAVLAWWLFRRTRPDPELFAPLEEMESRSWRKMSADERREALDASRPIGARPVGGAALSIDDDDFDESTDDDVIETSASDESSTDEFSDDELSDDGQVDDRAAPTPAAGLGTDPEAGDDVTPHKAPAAVPDEMSDVAREDADESLDEDADDVAEDPEDETPHRASRPADPAVSG